MFQAGDHVFYPKGGVFKIEKESNKSIAGRDIAFLDLVSCDTKTKISIPKANLERVGVRRLVLKNELDGSMATWVPDLKISKLHHKNRKSRFETLRKTGSFSDMGSVVTTIHHLIQTTKATFEERRMYDQIRKRLVDEVAIVRDLKAEMADVLIQETLNTAITRKPIHNPELDDVEALEETAAKTAATALV
jgi:RNA polymerase-interacting CarD/CdnL/TRCF family regulator